MQIIVKKSSQDNWYTIEKAIHDNRMWLDSVDIGGQAVPMLMYSGRITDSDVEGNAEDMHGIADAIERRTHFFAKRCAVDASKDEVEFWSPRNSITRAKIPIANAIELAAQIRTNVIRNA